MQLKDFDFRIWDIHAKAMCILGIYDIEKNAVIPIKPSDIVELWSGFYDKNETKIYKNDIVEYDCNGKNILNLVAYVGNTFYIVSPEIEKEFQVDCGTRLQDIYNNKSNGYKDNKLECLEVVGNIHENLKFLYKG